MSQCMRIEFHQQYEEYRKRNHSFTGKQEIDKNNNAYSLALMVTCKIIHRLIKKCAASGTPMWHGGGTALCAFRYIYIYIYICLIVGALSSI